METLDTAQLFSKWLKKLRANYNLTKEQLAEKADIPYRTLQDIEAGKPSCPNFRTILKLSKGFELTLSKFFENFEDFEE